MMGNENRFTFGPPRYYQPISAKGPTGWTFHGPIGYEEIHQDKGGSHGGKCVRHLVEPFVRSEE